ncbi:tyrosine recombinase XerD [Reticulibacter mediterranei]|uniref:Tyrosine recombinase XerD n=1 Tax=Reticulibacter mediterranei TaxID=2778369 RepID=A0A8J3IPK0_9CHLR|nr:tyrosine-type recombinase/integrase [Reticulibacter mediterranei]GHO98366.1 tyrosine recombinase XerD [Reticulibacter mediterranei]
MLQGQKLQQAYDDYIHNYSIEKGLEIKSIRNKKRVLDKLLPFLNGRPLTFETCREYAFYLYENGWTAPNSRVCIIKNLRAFINFLYDRGYIADNFAKKLVKPKVIRPPLRLPSEIDAEKCIIAGTEPGPADRARSKRIKAETRLCLQFLLRTGLRVSEALHLQGQDLSPFDDQPSFQVRSKGGRISLLPIPEDMIEEMKKRVRKKRVFEATADTCNKNLRDGMKKLNITLPLTCHKLRDIYSLSRLRRKNPLQLVSRTLRHSSVSITDKYYSDYILDDLVGTINDSPLIKKSLPAEQLVERGVDAFRKAIGNDNRIYIEVTKDTNGNAIIKTTCLKTSAAS